MSESGMIEHVGTPFDMFRQCLDVAGQTVVDVGCGRGGNARAIARLGADVIAVEVEQARVDAAAAGDEEGLAHYILGFAQDLPVEDRSADVLAYFNSFHHVPADAHDATFAEMVRVLKPGGTVYIQEPVARGTYYDVTRLIDDEAALYDLVEGRLSGRFDGLPLAVTARHRFKMFNVFSGPDQMKTASLVVDPGRQEAFDRVGKEFDRVFHERGEVIPEGIRFDHHYRATILRRD